MYGIETTYSALLKPLSVQQNLHQNPSNISSTARSMLIRGLKMTFRMRTALRASVEVHSDSIGSAINRGWPEHPNYPRKYSPWSFLPSDLEWWMISTVQATEFTSSQVVLYNLLEGYLLVDYMPLGSLPPEIRDSEIVQELFGGQHLRTFPSALPGMSYMLTTTRDGHWVHFGLRDGNSIIQAQVNETLLQFVERKVFEGNAPCDVPSPLIHDCVHWLNLKSGQLEFRPRLHAWTHNRPGNWTFHVLTRRALRGDVCLVDPHSALVHKIARIFKCFEKCPNVTVFQPATTTLTVELKRMDLNFNVNHKGLLESRQLGSEIDPDQDAGTWYGLQSKIVLRDTRNALKRSVIVPLGKLSYRRHGIHVDVWTDNDGRYGRYFIDGVLGRLQCASEPLLLYTKAQLHAFTAFVLPDPLTGRTGTEEALSCLSSASSQPWTVLDPVQLRPLLGAQSLILRRRTRHHLLGQRKPRLLQMN